MKEPSSMTWLNCSALARLAEFFLVMVCFFVLTLVRSEICESLTFTHFIDLYQTRGLFGPLLI